MALRATQLCDDTIKQRSEYKDRQQPIGAQFANLYRQIREGGR